MLKDKSSNYVTESYCSLQTFVSWKIFEPKNIFVFFWLNDSGKRERKRHRNDMEHLKTKESHIGVVQKNADKLWVDASI